MNGKQWKRERGDTVWMPPRAVLRDEVDAARGRIRTVDPLAYGGFVIDKAILAVARRTGLHWRVVYRAWRHFHPQPTPRRGIPVHARPVSDEGRAVA